jgi:hypothetical protein
LGLEEIGETVMAIGQGFTVIGGLASAVIPIIATIVQSCVTGGATA